MLTLNHCIGKTAHVTVVGLAQFGLNLENHCQPPLSYLLLMLGFKTGASEVRVMFMVG